ncbi:MAG: fused MFS/spermidine synthase [Erysipelotrichaceae bacterium]|nr:fused MFS/spermidine synthase [Erysipelotrichaceae bacterium]
MNRNEEARELSIYETTDRNGEAIIVADSGSAFQSASYLDPDKRYDLVFEYPKKFNRAFSLNPDARKMLILGGGGYGYPKYVISHYPDVSVDVVEIDRQVYLMACEYFFLDELIEEYELDLNHRFRNITADAEEYLKQTDEKYDIIINDLYDDLDPVYSLLTLQAGRLMKEHLNPNGIYVINLAGYRNLNITEYLLDVLKTLHECFENVQIVKAFYYPHTKTGNYVVFAGDVQIRLPEALPCSLDGSSVITDTNELRKQYEKFLG